MELMRKDGTNNIAELNALHQALVIAKQTSSENIISIFSDSKYAIDLYYNLGIFLEKKWLE